MSDGKMLVISGMEYHPVEGQLRWHLIGLNLPHGLGFTKVDDANACIRQIDKLGGLTILAHPHWLGVTGEQICKLKGLAAIEVYNTSCDTMAHGYSENEWNYALSQQQYLPAVGVDDIHASVNKTRHAFRSWTWLKMPSLTIPNVLKAIRTGSCYSSCGPEIKDFRFSNGKLFLECSPVVKVYFVGDPGRGASREGSASRPITSMKRPVVTKTRHVRAVVIDAHGNRAWTNPIATPYVKPPPRKRRRK